ncbi:MAG: hypothetical protein K0U79_13830 [Gammaproteobacteria bacterium]|nr:hypothetical protein [Gammaproteobacteria bacterium]
MNLTPDQQACLLALQQDERDHSASADTLAELERKRLVMRGWGNIHVLTDTGRAAAEALRAQQSAQKDG